MQLPYHWYDKADGSLSGAFDRLDRLAKEQRTLLSQLSPLQWSVWVRSVAGLGLATLFTFGIALHNANATLGAPDLVIVFYVIMGAGLVFNHWRWRLLFTVVRRGKYGQAVMFDGSQEWLLLNEELEREGLNVLLVVDRPDCQQILKKYLLNTQVQREELRRGRKKFTVLNRANMALEAAARVATDEVLALSMPAKKK